MAETLCLQRGRDVPGRAREWVRDICATCGLDARADDAALIVSELVTNVLLHANTDCLVVAELGGGTVRVAVMDEDSRDVRPVAAADSAERGRGLQIVAALSDAWGIDYQPAGKSVWFTLTRAAAVRTRPRVQAAGAHPPRPVAAGVF